MLVARGNKVQGKLNRVKDWFTLDMYFTENKFNPILNEVIF